MHSIDIHSPFHLENDNAYQLWRQDKIDQHPKTLSDIFVDIEDPFNVSKQEKAHLMDCINRCNMAIYQLPDDVDQESDKDFIYQLGKQFGLSELDHNLYADEDAISSLKVTAEKGGKGYIPYTNRPIAWHTDGYYNPGETQVRAMLLHCVVPAKNGGENRLMDHEMAYLMLRDVDIAHIKALSHPQAMSIPANIQDGKQIRHAVTGPVFSVDTQGNLHMRYTARTRSIEWLQDESVLKARDALEAILKSDSPYHLQGKLQPGQGLICNNVLHTRTKFEADSHRLLYRARYFDRITL
jgi:alpha-ketoglutarate-dependent taurine dioxygenase